MDLIIAILLALTLYWDAPTTREDGTALYSNEISHYEMFHNGTLRNTTEGTQMEVYDYGDYQVRAVDIDGQISELSNTVTHVRVKGKPSAPGQLRKIK